MKTANDKKEECLKITVNGKCVTLFFAPEPNREAADFIKKTLINAYLLKAV
jgi:hypothetical protein